MSTASPDLSRWSGVTSYLLKHVELEASAREHGALVRRRGVRLAADLLHLALLYGPGGLSLRSDTRYPSAYRPLPSRSRDCRHRAADRRGVISHPWMATIGGFVAGGGERRELVDSGMSAFKIEIG